MAVKAAEPRFHETVTIPIRGRPEGMRVVVTEDGVLPALVEFFEVARHQQKSMAWQHKVCRSVGLLYDYFRACPLPHDARSRRTYLSDFVRKLIAGTVGPDGSDPTGLGWRGMNWASVYEVVSYVNAFSDFCANQLGTAPLNPLVPATFAERVATYRRIDARNEHSLLKHLGNAKAEYALARQAREVVAPRDPKSVEERPPFFPSEHFSALFTRGFRRKSGGPPWEQYRVRDMMIVMLERYAGLRASEPFHLFVTDVREDPRLPGHAEVRLYHPELGRFSYKDALGRTVHTTRTDFLRDRYQRTPRNRMSGPEHAGWKNLMLDRGRPDYYTLVRWFPVHMGAAFWELYQIYIRHLLPRGLDHPYLFVNLSGGAEHGTPYKLGTFYKNLCAAVRRIGLTPEKGFGTTSHGFRHAFGQDLKDAKLSRKAVQVCMHHKSPTSQDVYTRPLLSEVAEELQAAWASINTAGHATPLLPPALRGLR